MASENPRSGRLRALNDQLRQRGIGGTILATAGVQALGRHTVALIIATVAQFDAFGSDNDPYGEHDFGALEVQGHRLFFKIDSYDRELRHQSPDPADPSVTHRVMTIMLSDEY